MKKNSKALTFLKRNAAYLVVALCIVAVGIASTLMIIERANQGIGSSQVDKPVVDNEQEKPTEPVIKVISFIMPVENPTNTVSYSEQMVFNSTLGHFSGHKAIDFFAEEGTNVVCVYDGTVESVDSTLLTGVTVTIDHGDGLKTVYNSLADGDQVTVGQTIKQGEVIGTVSTTNRQEYKEGAHLHFQVVENEQVIDPIKYLQIEEK